jgi:glycosyltransferase involved in cell wall biosynthesis
MKVLMVISQFHPMIGGAEKQAQLLAKKLIEKGIEVNIVTGWWNFRTPQEEIIEGIKVYRNFALGGPFGIKGNQALKKLGGLAYMVSLWIYLLVHGHEYDIIHVHQALHPAFISVLVGRQLLKKPVIVKTASSGVTSDIKQLKRVPLGGIQLRYLLRNMECLVTVSEVGGNEFKKVGFPKSHIVHIPNGVVLPHDGKANYGQVKRVLTTARLSKEKGIDILLKAWAHVIGQEKDPKLIILGDGILERELKKLSKSLGVKESVDFIRMAQNVADYLKNGDLFVLPSRTEGLSNALLEAMSHGLPCIATNVGGNIELFGENSHKEIMFGKFLIARNGLLTNPEDIEGLSEAMLYLIRNSKERETMGKLGRQHIQENYSIDLIADRYIELYQRSLNRRL